jgi:hypothetical protein
MIHRTIKNPKEKLYLFLKFIRDNQLSNDLFVMPENGIFKEVWVKESLIIDVLKIRPEVFIYWLKPYLERGFTVSQDYYGIELDNNTYGPVYVPLNFVSQFLTYHYHMALRNKNMRNKNKKDAKYPTTYDLYLKMDELFK